MTLSAHDFSKPLNGSTPVSFGLNNVPAQLHHLADQVDKGDALMHSVEVGTKASSDDFVLTTVTMVFAEKVR